LEIEKLEFLRKKKILSSCYSIIYENKKEKEPLVRNSSKALERLEIFFVFQYKVFQHKV
jgi:hypothetical protein